MRSYSWVGTETSGSRGKVYNSTPPVAVHNQMLSARGRKY